MNRFAFGASLLLLSPVVAGCGNFYILTPPPPLPAPTEVPPVPDFPMDPEQGKNTTLATPSTGIALNGAAPLPESFRAANVVYIPRTSGDGANCIPLLVLQSASTDAKGNSVPGTADVSNPVHLAGIIVPGPNAQASAGLRDPDRIAMQNQAYTRSLEAMRSWAQGPLVSSAAPTPAPTAPIPTGTPGARPTATAIPRALASRPLDVYQDPRFPIDSDNRRMVQIMFTSVEGIKVKPTSASGQSSASQVQTIVAPGTKLSLARMMLRSGWAVVDLYSSTSFDQATWLLDEAYARHRKLGIWGIELNGKQLSLQQRAPVTSLIIGSQSKVSVTTNQPALRPTSRPGSTGRPSANATQSPANVTPTLAPIAAPSTVPHSDSSVQPGPRSNIPLPPPSQNTAPAAAPAAGAGPGTGNTVQ